MLIISSKKAERGNTKSNLKIRKYQHNNSFTLSHNTIEVAHTYNLVHISN